MTRPSILIALVAVVCAVPSDQPSLQAADAAAVTPEQERYFEEKVRPVLVTKCVECHGPKKQESGLRLDSRQALLGGGDSGERAVVPGEPDRSLLVKAINHVGDFRMPPTTKLADDQIAALTEWVRAGSPWPGDDAAPQPMLSAADRAAADRQSHWAYQPVASPPLPAVKNAEWSRTSIDSFVLAKLEAAGLAPSPPADRRTLIRRLSFDLLGLPPTMAEVDAFAADPAPDAYERLVDRLLASPHHGERWGRHWLDVARYADTKGYAFAQERRYPYAYTYRDYVIAALNADLPYDRFLVEQLAADRVTAGEDKSSLAALGFLTTGRKFNNQPDDIDDQIDVVTRGLLGITVACARCHDHKYDAIPTEDYYSLYGVFASCSQPAELPLIAPPQESAAYQAFAAELDKLRGELDSFAASKHAEFLDASRKQSADYLARVVAGSQNTLLAKLPFLSLDPKDLRPRLIQRWQRRLDQLGRPGHPALGLWHELLKVSDNDFVAQATPIIARYAALPDGVADGQCNPLVKAAFAAEPPQARLDLARLYGQLFTRAYEAWQAAGANSAAVDQLPAEMRQLADLLLGKDSPTDIEVNDIAQYLDRAERNKHSELKKKVEAFQASSPAAPPRAMIVVDNSQPVTPRVLIRGNPGRPGNEVPRQFPLVLAGDSRQPFSDGSGRLELARAITSRDNPLTRRVIANRLWMHHLGEPLAMSPSDFGVRSERPVQAELLDFLAALLLDREWSLKALHREIVHSATYQQSSNDRPECRTADPENRLWWRAHRRRLELEALRDSLLAVAGQLDETSAGRPVELTTAPFTRRRAVYGYIDRQDLPNLFRVFDIASPDQSSPRRPRTTVPQQALFLLNSPFVVEQARALAAQLPGEPSHDDGQRIAALYRAVVQRQPLEDEAAIGRQFVVAAQADTEAKLNAWEQYAQLLLLTNEVMYVD